MSLRVGLANFSPEIENEIMTKGYHIFNQDLPIDDYPNSFNIEKKVKEIVIGKCYTLRIFVKIDNGLVKTIDSGLIDIKILKKNKEGYLAKILTLLPDGFPLKRGQEINVKREEILYEQLSQISN